MAATIVSAAVVFGVLGYRLTQTSPNTTNSPAPTSARSSAVSQTSVASNTAKGALAAASPRNGLSSAESATAESRTRVLASAKPRGTSVAPIAKAVPNRATLLRAQLEAGEFGPALKTARSSADAAERSQLLKAVADAQAKVGDFRSAELSTSQIPVPAVRDEARAANSVRHTAAGGGVNPGPLIALIKSVTGEETDWSGGDDDARKQPQFWLSGIDVNPNGLLRALTRPEQDDTLSSLGHRAREADLNTDMRAQSSLRLVSLTRLEREVSRRLAEGRDVSETMQHLAGLSHVHYVFIYPDQHEVVIGGPAEGWRYNENGLAVGREGGQPTLYLDDLVTVLRTFSSHGPGYFNCQIVPREDGLRKIKQFVEASSANGSLSPGAVRGWTHQLQQALGLQDVEINGVPNDSRVAQVIFEADYRLKMIGIGKLPGGPGIPNYFDLLPKTGAVKSESIDALRWWLSMKYDAVTHSTDHNVFEIQGSAVLCQSENEKISTNGQRIHTGKAEAANRLFAANFTRHYVELASHDLIFADLQNVFDLSLVAALLTDNRVPARLGWDLGAFGSTGVYRAAHYEAPKAIESVVNHRVYNGQDIVVQVAGGVDGQIRRVLEDSKVVREAKELSAVQTKARAPELASDRWWWDAKGH